MSIRITGISAKGLAALFLGAISTLPEARAATISLDVPVSEALGFAPTQLYYTMNSIIPGATNTTADSSGNGNTGNLHNGNENVPPTSVLGKFGNAIHFEGTSTVEPINPFLYASSSSSLQLTGISFTMGAWLNFDSILGGSYNVDILGKGYQGGAGGNPGYTFYLGKSSTDGNWSLNFETRDGTSLGEVSTGLLGLNLQAGSWYHFGLSYDDVSGQVIFYVDGAVVGTQTRTVSIANGADFFNLNERGVGTWNSWFDGAYDDAFITSGVYTFSPVPEPSVVALSLLGLGMVFWARKRTL